MIRVQTEDFDIASEIARLSGGRDDIGAVVTFTGIVRRGPDADPIKAMTLEHYPGMTEKELARIKDEALARWPLQDCLIIHRYGRLVPGDNIVLVITLSEHRQAAFDAANFLMDYLKTNAPFWKSEERQEGRSWVAARESDDQAQQRWEKESQSDR